MPETTSVHDYVTKSQLKQWSRDSIRKLIKIIDDLNEQQQIGAYHRLLNPPLWEVTHALWFVEHWVFRDVLDYEPYFEDVDDVYNSIRIRHGQRWAADLIPFHKVKSFADYLNERLEAAVDEHYDDELFTYRLLYATSHNDMHTEAETFQRQGRGLPAPTWVNDRYQSRETNGAKSLLEADVHVEGGTYPLGSARSEPFVFDNEKWVHNVDVDSFDIAATPVTQGQFRAFVEDGGYLDETHWSPPGWEFLQLSGYESPRFWKKRDGEWLRRQFDRWKPVEDNKPMVHVSYYEAQAYCNWAGRRLPTEAEWELAATGWDGGNPGELTADGKRRYPWGDAPPNKQRANLDWHRRGVSSVLEHAEGDSPTGCRGMIGNVWEWTSTLFEPFEGFEPDFYLQYSEPWFGSRYCMRGGSWCTRSRLIRTGFRNFYTPSRNDRYLGFRTCAIRD